MGQQSLKNIADPMRAWRVRLTGQTPSAVNSGSAVSQPRVLPLPDKPSIAVLPFENMSGDPEQEYFADGMVEEIITALPETTSFSLSLGTPASRSRAELSISSRSGANSVSVTCWRAVSARPAIAFASPDSSWMPRPAITSGRTDTTVHSKTFSICRIA
jgi:hypothetical protein